MQKPTWVICRLKYDPHKKGQKADSPESSDENTSDIENPVASAVIPEVRISTALFYLFMIASYSYK